ncbi:NAD(P)H-binding protein [Ruminococcus callidus]
MNIAILGATGTFGTALTNSLLNHTEYQLTLLSRHAENYYQNSERITAINIDATNAEDLRTALHGTNVVYCAISREQLPIVAENLVNVMSSLNISRLLFMSAVGIYNEIPVDLDGDDNLENEPAQIPNRKAADIIESSNLNYTILRPGYLRDGSEDDYVLTVKGERAKGYISTIPSVVAFAEKLISDEMLFSCESVSITKNMEN